MTAPSRSMRSRLILAGACLITAATAAFVMKAVRPESGGTAPEEARAASAEDVLAALPPPSTTAAGKLRSAAVARVRSTPQNAAAWTALGDALAQESRDTALTAFSRHAEAAYQAALSISPASPEAMTGLSWAHGQRHDFDSSMAWARKALAVRADLPDAFGLIGDAELELGNYDSALDSYQRMMDLRPDLSSWSRGAHLLWITGNKSKAMWLMERAIKAGAPYAENTAWCRARLAMMLFHDGALLPAAQVLEPAIAAGSQNTHVLLAAARVAAAMDKPDEARKHCDAILKAGPNLEALALMGDLCAAAGDKEGASNFYRQVEALHTSHVAGGVHDHMVMAKFLADHDRDPVAALRLAEPAKLTKNVQEADTLAWVYLKNNDIPSAVAMMKRALSRNTPDAELRYHAGMIAAAAGDRTSAKKHLQEALSFNSRFSVLQASRAAEKLESLSLEVAAGNDSTRE